MAEKRADFEIWSDILKLQLDGVMMHTILFEEYSADNLTGYRNMHKHHAEEEFHTYLHILNDYINTYQEIPEIAQVFPPVVKLDGTTVEEKMANGIKIYQEWEQQICSELQFYKKELSQEIELLDKLICNVHEELKCINLMQNELLDGKYEELNCYLTKKWGD